MSFKKLFNCIVDIKKASNKLILLAFKVYKSLLMSNKVNWFLTRPT